MEICQFVRRSMRPTELEIVPSNIPSDRVADEMSHLRSSRVTSKFVVFHVDFTIECPRHPAFCSFL